MGAREFGEAVRSRRLKPSPVRRESKSRLQKLAAARALGMKPVTAPVISESLLARCAIDIASVKGLDQAAKRTRKRELVKKWKPDVEALLKQGVRDLPHLGMIILWMGDLQMWGDFLPRSKHAEALGWTLRPYFKQNRWINVRIDSLREWIAKQLDANHSPEPYLSQIYNEVYPPNGGQSPAQDVVRAKIARRWASIS